MPLPPAANYHVNRACNARCRFCFAVFSEVPGALSRGDALRLIAALAEAGVEKLNFAGGEPTLWPHLAPALREARRLGLTTSIVTNGFRLGRVLDQAADCVDWVGFSVDSWSERTEVALGRGRGDHVARCVALAARARALGVRVKLNTVLTALNADEDLSPLVRAMRPERWKVFQVLPVEGQNDGRVEPLRIDAGALERFRARHAPLAAEGFAPVIEDNAAMRGSYAMIDPMGRFFSNASGRHTYSDPILELGAVAAFRQVVFDEARFDARGGRYGW
ncbi:MAG: radical SAM protein [Alphaproteobacteria bacterium]|nr:radical SAM protein [Alphaproteobacteria bacterium]